MSSNTDAQKGPDLEELDPNSSVILAIKTEWKRVFYEVSNIRTGLNSSQFPVLHVNMRKCIHSSAADVIGLSVCSHEAERDMRTLLTSTHLSQAGQQTANRSSTTGGYYTGRRKPHVPSMYYPFLHLIPSHLAFARTGAPASASRRKSREAGTLAWPSGSQTSSHCCGSLAKSFTSSLLLLAWQGKEGADKQIHYNESDWVFVNWLRLTSEWQGLWKYRHRCMRPFIWLVFPTDARSKWTEGYWQCMIPISLPAMQFRGCFQR